VKNILIIGSSGFIGNHLKKKLKKNYNLICPKRNNKFNIKNKFQLKKYITEDVDIIINLTGQININKQKMFETIVRGNQNIIDIVLSLKKNILVYYFSTTLVYGYSSKILSENSKVNPISSYSKYKRLVEINYLNSKINFKIFRVSNVFSKNKIGIIQNLINYFQNDKKIIITNLNTFRNYISIEDFGNIISLIIKKKLKKKIYNIGSENKSIKDIIDTIESKIKKKIYFKNKKIKLKKLSSQRIKKCEILNEISYKPKIKLINYMLENINI